MHDVSAPGWRQTLDRHHTALVDDLTAQVAAEIESSVNAERERIEDEAARERERIQNDAALECERANNDAARERERVNIEAARADLAESQLAVAQAAGERERSAHEAERAGLSAALEAAELQAANSQEAERAAREQLRLAAADSRRKLAESVNQTLRRFRQTTAEYETLELLLEASAASADRAVVLLIENDHARVAVWRGAAFVSDFPQTEPRDGEPAEEPDSGQINLTDAPAIASCVESRDPVIAMLAAGEISPLLATALSGAGADKAYLFPVTLRQTTVAILVASGNVAAAATELLCEAAGMKLETFESVDMTSAPAAFDATQPLIQIAETGAPSAHAYHPESTPTSWSKLTPEQQALHLRAQRVARVRVAQIRISESDALRTGVRTGNIYSAVRQSIDSAREEFQKAFMSQSPTMVDYLHLEVTRSLAHDDSRLLGEDYPGPLV